MFLATDNLVAIHRMLRHVSGSGKSKMATIRTGSTCILPSRRDRNVVSNPNSMFLGTDKSMTVHRMLRHGSGSEKSKMATIRTGSTRILPSRRDRNVVSNPNSMFLGTDKSMAVHRMFVM